MTHRRKVLSDPTGYKSSIFWQRCKTHTHRATSNPSRAACRGETCPSLADQVQHSVCIRVPQWHFLFFRSSRVCIMSLSCVTTSRHTWSDTSAVCSSCGNTLYHFTPQIRHKRAYITPYLVLDVYVTNMCENMSCFLNEKCLGAHTHKGLSESLPPAYIY